MMLGITQKKMANSLGMGYKDYCVLERGMGEINFSIAEQIALVLGIRVFNLFDPGVLLDSSETSRISRIIAELETLDDESIRIIFELTQALAIRSGSPELPNFNFQSR